MRPFVISLLLLLAVSVHAQQPSDSAGVVLSGRVVSSADGDELAHVSVSAPEYNVSTVTNEDGEFMLKTPARPTHLILSHLGFHTRRITVKEGQTDRIKVRMQPSSIVLSEVLVSANDPMVVVRAAIKKIPENYSTQPSLMHCFYRETAQRGSRFIAVSEAVTDLYKTSYEVGDTYGDAVQIVRGRRLLSTRAKDTLAVKLMGGPVIPIMLDAVKNSQLLLNEQELSLYDLHMEIPERIGERAQYVVSLSPRYRVMRPLFYARLYIDQETLAFTRVELELDVSNRDLATEYMLVRRPPGLRFNPKQLTTTINYKTVDSVTCISYVRNEMRFKCDWKRRLFASTYTVVSEMVVTEVVPQAEVRRIRGRDSFGQRETFYDRVEFFDEPDFWGAYNIIAPTESLEHAIDKLKKQKRQ